MQMIAQMFKDYKEIQCLGMYGMGGLGKMTICRALCGYFGPSFNHKVYHLQIGSNDSHKARANLLERHRELLRNLFGLSWEITDRNQDPCKVLLQTLMYVVDAAGQR